MTARTEAAAKKVRRLKPSRVGDPAWWRMAYEVAAGFAPRIQACRDCLRPVCNGYCCTFCESPKGGHDV